MKEILEILSLALVFTGGFLFGYGTGMLKAVKILKKGGADATRTK